MTGETLPHMPKPQIFVEQTMAIIKPDAVHFNEEIEDTILKSGYTILQVNIYVILLRRAFRMYNMKGHSGYYIFIMERK